MSARKAIRRPRPSTLSGAAVRCLVPAGVTPATITVWLNQARRRLRAHPGTVSVAVIGPAEMARLNWQWRRKSGPTNVLSFAYQTRPRFDPEVVWGEIFLCPAVIRREAKLQQRSYRDYFRFLLQHGLLHLTGLDHRTVGEQRRWSRLEQRLAHP